MNIARILNGKNTVLNSIYKSWSILYPAWTPKETLLSQVKSFSCFSSLVGNTNVQSLSLTPLNPLVLPSKGLKVRGRLQLRCKDCYFARKDGELYVLCSSFPRHKQIAMRKRLKYRWLLTYAFQSKVRPY